MKQKTKELLWFITETVMTAVTVATVMLVVAAVASGVWQYPG